MNKAPIGESMDKIEIEDDENDDNNFQVQNESVYMNQGVQKPQLSARAQGPSLKVTLEVKQQTKPFIPTRLSEIEQSQIEVLVSDGLISTKKSIFSTTHSLSFKVNIPHLKTDLRRLDEEFDHL